MHHRNEDRWRGRHSRWPGAASTPRSPRAPGRLFDAVAAILGVRDVISYEGQAAIELEQLAAPGETGSYPARVDDAGVLIVHAADLAAAVVDDLKARTPREIIAARFHNGVADLIAARCATLRDQTGLGTVALSGGVFANSRLSESVVDQLEGRGFTVLTHSRVPCNDGGISLGQAAIAPPR